MKVILTGLLLTVCCSVTCIGQSIVEQEKAKGKHAKLKTKAEEKRELIEKETTPVIDISIGESVHLLGEKRSEVAEIFPANNTRVSNSAITREPVQPVQNAPGILRHESSGDIVEKK